MTVSEKHNYTFYMNSPDKLSELKKKVYLKSKKLNISQFSKQKWIYSQLLLFIHICHKQFWVASSETLYVNSDTETVFFHIKPSEFQFNVSPRLRIFIPSFMAVKNFE